MGARQTPSSAEQDDRSASVQRRPLAPGGTDHSPTWQPLLTAARLSFDAAVVVVATASAFLIRFELGWFAANEVRSPDLRSHVIASLVWISALLGAMAMNRLYDDDTLFIGGGETPRVLRSVVEAVAALSMFVYFTRTFSVSRSWFGLTALGSAASLTIERLLVRRLIKRERDQGRFRRPVILVSRDPAAHLEPAVSGVLEFMVVARADPGRLEEVEADPRLRGADLVMAASDVDEAGLWKIVIEAGRKGRSVFLLSPVRAVRRDRLTVREVGGRTVMKVAPPYFTGLRAIRKRAFDAAVSATLLILSLPVMVVLALAILVTSGWPVLYRQDRVGKDGKLFRIWKLRTMRRGADQSGETLASREDPRRTKLGAFLRRTSLDELPQLWNVLVGHMSLVGPRPLWVQETEHPRFAERFDEEMPWFGYRHRIRPGITGWAQIHGLRGHTPLDPWVQHDNWYIENWSTALDIKILLKTLGEVIRGRNAY